MPKYTTIVGSDFIDHEGTRFFCFQLCRPQKDKPDRLEAVAIINYEGNTIRRSATIDSLKNKWKVIERLATAALKKSIPQDFRKGLTPPQPQREIPPLQRDVETR